MNTDEPGGMCFPQSGIYIILPALGRKKQKSCLLRLIKSIQEKPKGRIVQTGTGINDFFISFKQKGLYGKK